MCYRPLKIPNKSYHKTGGLPYNYVPCGKCDECTNVKRIDYTIRSLALFQTLPDYDVWFSTLTFDPVYLPKAKLYKRVKSVWQDLHTDVACFNHDLLHTFTKSLKQWFRRHGYIFHYMITCEYGDIRHRPHYHAIFFVPKIFHDWQAFRDFITRFWTYGFVKNVRVKQVDGVTSLRDIYNSIKYVCKYASKNASWLPIYCKDPEHYALDGKPSQYLPRVFTSNQYGSSLESLITEQQYESNSITISTGKKYQRFKIPRYYLRKHFIKYVPIAEQETTKMIYHPGTPSFPSVHEHKYVSKYSQTLYNPTYETFRLNCLYNRLLDQYNQTLDYSTRTAFTPDKAYFDSIRYVSADRYAYIYLCQHYRSLDGLDFGSVDSDELCHYQIVDDTIQSFRHYDMKRREQIALIDKSIKQKWYKRHIFKKNIYK